MKFFQNEFYQGSLTDEQCASLKHIIKSANYSDIESIKQAYADGVKPIEITERGTLTDAQTVGVAYMYYARRCLLGDQVGLGKTVECAGLLNVIKQDGVRNILFLTEKTIVPQIRDKLIKFTGEYVDMIPSML